MEAAEAATLRLAQTARGIFDLLQSGGGAGTEAERAALSSAVRSLSAEFEEHMGVVAAAAEGLDSMTATVTEPKAEASAIEVMTRERNELRAAVRSRNELLRQQMDALRELLADIQYAGGDSVVGASAK